MGRVVNWVQVGAPLTFGQAVALAAQAGGQLLVNDQPGPWGYGYIYALGEDYTNHNIHENPAWISGGATQELDPGEPVDQFIIQYTGNNFVGTDYNDAFMRGGIAPGQTIRMLGGNDFYSDYEKDAFYPAGGTIYAGDGDDYIYVTEGGKTTVYDGDGRDMIDISDGVIKAALDGDDDYYNTEYGRVSYGDAKVGLVGAQWHLASSEIGLDTVYAKEIVGGSGDDALSGWSRIQGGKGNDTLAPGTYAEGGDGNDTLIADAAVRVELRAEAGSDTLVFYTAAKASGGAGADNFVFKVAAPVTLQDWTAGERLDISALSDLSTDALFSGGYLNIAHDHGYTKLLYDADGGGDGVADFVTLKGVFAASVLKEAIHTGGPPLGITQAYFTTPIPVFGAVTRVSTSSDGTQANAIITYSANSYGARISDDGHYALFTSYASNLVAGDTNAAPDLFRKDLVTNETVRVSTDTFGGQVDNSTFIPGALVGEISGDGRYVVFASPASTLVAGDANGAYDVFLKDLATNQILRVSTSAAGVGGDSHSYEAELSADGRYVVFRSDASNLVADDLNSTVDIFRKDLLTGEIVLVSKTSAGTQANSFSFSPEISADGRYVVFTSAASNLVAGDNNGAYDIFRKDLSTNQIIAVSTSSTGGLAQQGPWQSADSYSPQISADGRYVVFASMASDLVAGDTNQRLDIFRKDLVSGDIVRVSVDALGQQALGYSYEPFISPDGRYVTFLSDAYDLIANDAANLDVFRKDVLTGAITRLSVDASGHAANGDSGDIGVSPDGRFVIFTSAADNLAVGDTNGAADIFVVDTMLLPEAADVALRLEFPGGAAGSKTADIDWSDAGGGQEIVTVGEALDALQAGESLPDGRGGRVDYALVDGNQNSESGRLRIISSGTGAVRLSSDVSGGEANGASVTPQLSADGRYLVFASDASDLVAGDTNSKTDIFRKDLVSGVTVLVSSDAAGDQANGNSYGPAISADGRYVVFTSEASDLVAGDTNGHLDIFRKDLVTGEVARGSTSSANLQGNESSFEAQISADGRYVSFETLASNLAGSIEPGPDFASLLRKDLTTGETVMVRQDYNYNQQISSSGRYLVYSAYIEDREVQITDVLTGETTAVPVSLDDFSSVLGSYNPSFTADERYVLFESPDPDLVADDTNDAGDIFLKDLSSGQITRVSTDSAGGQSNGYSSGGSISANGRYVIYLSNASNLVAGDSDQRIDLFRKDLLTGEVVLVAGVGATYQAVVSDAGEIIIASESAGLTPEDLFLVRPDVISSVTGGDEAEFLRGGAYADALAGGDGRDLLRGDAGRDTLAGDAGDDELEGGFGEDLLTGGPGSDRFVFAGLDLGVDTITDFISGQDRLVIFAAMFGGGLRPGDQLVAGLSGGAGNLLVSAADPFASPLGTSGAFLYDQDDGRLWYDPDGAGATSAILLATLVNTAVLQVGDFLLL